MAMTVRELAKWLSEFHDQDAQVYVVEGGVEWEEAVETALHVGFNVEYDDHRQLDPERYALAGQSFLTLGKA